MASACGSPVVVPSPWRFGAGQRKAKARESSVPTLSVTAGARGGSEGALPPCEGKQYAFDFCRLLSAFVVGPELERAQVGQQAPRARRHRLGTNAD